MRKSSGREVTDVEDAILSRYSSQRQLRSGLVFAVGSPSTTFVENGSKDFDQTWHECSAR